MSRPILDVVWRTDGGRARPGHVAIVVDVLRACTNLITAFSMGAEKCFATTSIDEARQVGQRYNGLLLGERHNRKIQGFDYGNSPVELEPAAVKGRTFVFTSTNFPHALLAAEDAAEVFLGAPVNLSAVCERVLEVSRSSRADITIVLAGESSQRHAAEDLYFAGLAARKLSNECRLTEVYRRAMAAMAHLGPEEAANRSLHARELIESGFADDVDFAFTIDRFANTPHLEGDWITPG